MEHSQADVGSVEFGHGGLLGCILVSECKVACRVPGLTKEF